VASLTLHLNYVAGYTGPLLFLFERTHYYSADNQGLVPWRLRRLGRSKVRSTSLVRVLSEGKISWALGTQGLRNPPPPTIEAKHLSFYLFFLGFRRPNLITATLIFFEKKKKKKKENPKERHPRWSHLRATEPGY